ncbi:hypothetical protein N657DRAFT_694647 [Parathielavia appendiculata]|uniref:Uncharacterized protein n=1 Tax=Parathielavia appendiculata TaxID=2587402 RepID=A0AAN6TP78_9PEZI|nr:hypothetical protein N657DRAFT_694647 [Parathielavia appendiculata]
MLQTTSSTVFLFIAWLLFAATSCLAGKRPSASIEFIPGPPRSQRRYHRDSEYGAAEVVYGPLVPRMHGVHNQSEPHGRRANPDGMDEYGPLLRVPGCFYCPPQNVLQLTGRPLLDSLTTAKMQQYMRVGRPEDLKNKCVFYTAYVRVPKPDGASLSKEASDWACSKSKFSIWHLWPNKIMETDPRFNGQYRDFYGIDRAGNWLNSIYTLKKTLADRGVPPTIQYFENMSEAMARSCSGEVVIMTQTPGTMGQYAFNGPNIWWNKERPALLSLKAQGKITRFLVVNWNNPNEIWELDLDSNQRGARVDPGALMSRDLHNETEATRLLHRAVCESSGLAEMLAVGDPFTDNYDLFPTFESEA